jgi:hypothetical protein
VAEDTGMTIVLFASFAIVSQCLLLAYFIDRRLKTGAADRYGWIVYGMGVPALLLAVLFIVEGEALRWWLGPLLFAAWAAFGFAVDSVFKVPWRGPIDWPVFVVYVALYSAAQVMLWIPLWFIHPALWGVYAVLFGLSTSFNMLGHVRAGTPD